MLMNALSKGFGRLFPSSFSQDDRALRPGLAAEHKRFFEENGFLILPRLFAADTIARLRDRLDFLWAERATMRDVPIDMHFGLPDAARIHFRHAPADARLSPYKILDLHLEDPVIRDICTDPALVGVLKNLLGATPLVCNSLLFEWGSQQEAHFDTFYMPSPTPNMMAASWIAIDRVTETNGPLYYYPGSHLVEPFRFSHGRLNAILSELETDAAAHIDRIVRLHRLEKQIFMPEPGDVLIWHAQLLHGGSPILDPAEPRRSLVTHYWTETDFPDPARRLEVGPGRWVLRRDHQYVVDDAILGEIDAFLATLPADEAACAAVPDAFDARRYLARNQDVLRAGENPWRHYATHGRTEGRIW
jgi:ectoine hydroxylase-related dioxygenase (phytanoyl-CoA dioxygenase family)